MTASLSTALIERVYDAALERDGWSGLMSDLVATFNGSQAALLSQDNRSGVARVRAHTAGVSAETLRAYETYYAPRSPLFHHFKSARLGVPYTDTDYPDQSVYLKSEIYNEFYRPLNAEHLLGVDLEHSAGLSTYLIVRRGDDAGYFGPDEIRRFAVLGRHFTRALRLNRLTDTARQVATALEAVLNRLPDAVMLTDAGGRISYLNPAAENLAASDDGLRIRQGRLRCQHPGDGTALDHLIAAAGRGDPTADGGVVAIRRRSSAIPLMVEVTSLPTGLAGSEACPLVMLRVVERKIRAPEPCAIVRLLGLTPAEAGVTAALCRGESLAEHAARNAISLHTARTLLRNAMAKTETHRQAALVSLVLSMT